MRALPLLLLLLLPLAAACDSGGAIGAIALSTGQSSYAAGDAVTLRLLNNSETAVRVSLCAATLERQQTSGGWTILPASGGACTGDTGNVLLESGATATVSRELPGDLVVGRYRFGATVETGSATALAYAEFDVD